MFICFRLHPIRLHHTLRGVFSLFLQIIMQLSQAVGSSITGRAHPAVRCRGKFVAPGKFFPPPYCHNVTNANPYPNPNPKFNPILNLNPYPVRRHFHYTGCPVSHPVGLFGFLTRKYNRGIAILDSLPLSRQYHWFLRKVNRADTDDEWPILGGSEWPIASCQMSLLQSPVT